MSFNFTAIKAALKDAGHLVSEGEEFVAKDWKELADFAHFHFGLSASKLQYGLAYPSTITNKFPGHPDAPKAEKPAAAPTATPTPTAAPAPAPAPTPTPAPTPAPAVTPPATPSTSSAPTPTPTPTPTPAATTPAATPATGSAS